ncbi:tetraacyldisaccharide 4'-kinase [Cytophagales bacterium LB-30]|uniref:Tetraacyldisaccharide 4'-kinase n=1 Tax=Shiella aurantiaca TaxID=3058365 RepID=A0ABT8F139_9BACT|nr:tetraacyldisaccharide 4'-kinase [Shiella aurantiaca]MDN4164120.1 tetraacyldisaccharide 4'-kinase [Shiella aurantiaca]
MLILRYLLFPLALLYGAIMALRNFLYSKGILHSHSFPLPIISVGNLTVGGTGKTPMVEYLLHHLASNKVVATLSRGYGRATKGYIALQENSTAARVGDEPLQMFLKFRPQVQSVVCENRVEGVQRLKQDFPNTEVILLDDAYQHRALKAGFSILLCDYNRPFYEDFMMPTGNLREFRSGANRAHAIVVTKCPEELSSTKRNTIQAAIARYAPACPVFFTQVQYQAVRTIQASKSFDAYQQVVLLTGIARPEPMKTYLSQQKQVVKLFAFPDHHNFTESDLEKVQSEWTAARADTCLVTTEKDYMRLKTHLLDTTWAHIPVFVLPIGLKFVEQEEEFLHLIDSFVSSF